MTSSNIEKALASFKKGTLEQKKAYIEKLKKQGNATNVINEFIKIYNDEVRKNNLDNSPSTPIRPQATPPKPQAPLATTGIQSTPQYQIYRLVIDALRKNGYGIQDMEIKENIERVWVNRGKEHVGELFVVEAPKRTLLKALFSDVGDMVDGHHIYNLMRGVADIHMSKGGAVYWPDDSLIGGFTEGYYGDDDEWVNYLVAVL